MRIKSTFGDKDKRLRHYTKDDLEILIATMDRMDLSFLEHLFARPVNEITANVLIINQSKAAVIESPRRNIRVVNTEDQGISRSRNRAIHESTGSLLWIMDDDCEIKPDAISTIVNAFNTFPEQLITFQTEVQETGKPYWNYPKNSQPFIYDNIFQTLSPEIVFKKEIIGHLNGFDERFGLGAPFADAENYIFLKGLKDHDINGYFVNKVIVSHPQYNSSNDAATMRVVYARGAVAGFNGKILFLQAWKYAFYLWRENMLRNPFELWNVVQEFQRGGRDFHRTEKN